MNTILIASAAGIIEILLTVLFCGKVMNLFFVKTGENAAETEKALTGDAAVETGKDKKISYYTNTQSILITAAASVIFFLASFFLIDNTDNIFGFLKLSVVLLAVVIAAITDFKLRIIPNTIILVGIAIRVVIYVFEILYFHDVILEIAKNDLIGLAIGFGILFVAHLISKSSVGMGDVKLFALIGICSGAICTYTTLLVSLIINTVVSVVLMLAKKKSKKDSVPFAPAICVGYLVSVFIASF